MKEVLLIMGFGAIGALSRFGITKAATQLFGPIFPFGTLIANVAGCLIIGLIIPVGAKLAIPKVLLSGLVVGFLGALTTFSSFGYATFELFREGAVGPAVANIGLNLVLGLLAVWMGVLLGRAFV
jgi:fluoride exporter